MCYSAQIRHDFRKFERAYGAAYGSESEELRDRLGGVDRGDLLPGLGGAA